MENKPLNILFLCSWFPNPESPSHGIFYKRHAQALALKHNVTVLYAKALESFKEDEMIETFDGNYTEYCLFYPKIKNTLPIVSSFLKFNNYKTSYSKLLNKLRGHKFDIIHVNTLYPVSIAALKAIKMFPSASVFVSEQWSGYYPEDGNYKGFLTKYFSQKLIKKAKAVFVVSEKSKQAMLSHGLSAKYDFVNNVVDTSVFKPIDNSSNDNHALRILHVSSLVDREKNISGIIDVAQRLKDKGIDFQLYFIGKNDKETIEYKKLIHQNHLHTHITFLGYKSPGEISTYMNSADVFLLFSNFEGMPNVILESLACGLPVISTNVGQVQKMIQPGMGIVLEKNTIEECVEQLTNFKQQKIIDKQFMHQYIIDNYGMQAVSNSITHLYHKYSSNNA